MYLYAINLIYKQLKSYRYSFYIKISIPRILKLLTIFCLKKRNRDFPGGPVVKTSPSNAGVVGSIPGWGAKIPHASRPKNQNIKQKQYCNKFNKDF